MRKLILTLLSILILLSCRSVRISQDLTGEYFKQGKDYSYNLTINRDSSFTFVKKYFEVNSRCHGRWLYLSKDTLLLRCDKEEFPAQLLGGYMSEREKRVFLLGKNKLKLGKTILKRK